jgi:hypothetical protein
VSRALRRGTAAIALAVVLVAGTGAPAFGQTATDPAYTAELVSQSPYVQAGETFTLQLDIDGALPTDRVKVDIWGRRTALATRSQLRNAYETSDYRDLITDGLTRLGSPYSATLANALDVSTGLVTLTVPEDGMNVDPGVYPLTVSIVRDGKESETLLTTTLVRLGPVGSGGPLNVALVVPVAADLALQPDGTVTLDGEDRVRLSALAGFLNGGFGSVPVTLEPRPETVDAIASGSSNQNAEDTALLAQLQQAATGRQVLGGTYVPVDEEALRQRDLDLLVGDLHKGGERALRDNGFVIADREIGRIARTDPSDTADTLTLRSQYGASVLLLPDRALQPLDADRFPATLLQSFVVEDSTGTEIPALASDAYLSDLAAAIDDARGDTTELVQRFIADLVVGYYDDPDLARGTAIVLPDDLDLTGDNAAVASLLKHLRQLPQLQFATLDGVREAISPASPLGGGRTETEASGPLVRTLTRANAADLESYPGRLVTVDRELAGFASIAGSTGGPHSADLERLRLVSADERLDTDARNRYLDGIHDAIRARLLAPDGGPGLLAPGTQRVTMTSRRATIPIQIENRLDFPANVRIELKADKLDFPTGWLRETTLAPGPNTIEVEVEAKTSGDSRLEVTVLPPDTGSGLGTLATATFTVRSTALSGLGLVISIVAMGVLLVWWGRHVVRVRRTRRTREASGAAEVTGGRAAGSTNGNAPEPAEDAGGRRQDADEAPTLTRTES